MLVAFTVLLQHHGLIVFLHLLEKKCVCQVGEVGSHLDAAEHIMISLLNAPFPPQRGPWSSGQAWLLDTLCRLRKGFKLHNHTTFLPPLFFFFPSLDAGPYLHTMHCLSPGTASLSLLSPTLPSEIIYSIAGLSATSHYMARTLSHWKD